MSEPKNPVKPNQLNIELSDEIAEGIYSNLAIISHSHSEFILDFIRLLPNVPKAKDKSRIILTPHHAKKLLKALSDNIEKFENQFGEIQEQENPPFPPMNFNTPKAQA
jgi:ribonuclease BN (tRNA processing enzyme)